MKTNASRCQIAYENPHSGWYCPLDQEANSSDGRVQNCGDTTFIDMWPGLHIRLEGRLPFAPEYLGGIAALLASAIVVVTLRASKKRVVYSSISFALFLFLVGIYWIGLNLMGHSPNVSALIMITSIVTSILLFVDL
jgi:hypothetical protein